MNLSSIILIIIGIVVLISYLFVIPIKVYGKSINKLTNSLDSYTIKSNNPNCIICDYLHGGLIYKTNHLLIKYILVHTKGSNIIFIWTKLHRNINKRFKQLKHEKVLYYNNHN